MYELSEEQTSPSRGGNIEDKAEVISKKKKHKILDIEKLNKEKTQKRFRLELQNFSSYLITREPQIKLGKKNGKKSRIQESTQHRKLSATEQDPRRRDESLTAHG